MAGAETASGLYIGKATGKTGTAVVRRPYLAKRVPRRYMAAIIRHFADRMPAAVSAAPAAVIGLDKAIYNRMARQARVSWF